MIVIKCFAEGYHYDYSAESIEEGLEAFKDEMGMDPESWEEIPEEKWDERLIQCYGDNDTTNEPFQMTIREAAMSGAPQMIFTNDQEFF